MVDAELLEWSNRLYTKYNNEPIKYIEDCTWGGKRIGLLDIQKRMINFESKYKATIILCPRDQGKTVKNAMLASYFYAVKNKVVCILSLSHDRSKEIKQIASAIQEDTEMLAYALPFFKIDNVDHLTSPLGGAINAVPFSTRGIMGGHPDIYIIDEASQFYDNRPEIEEALFTRFIIPSQEGQTKKVRDSIPEIHITSVGGDELSYFARFINTSLTERIAYIPYSFDDISRCKTQNERYKYLCDIISDEYIKKNYPDHETKKITNPIIYHAGDNIYKLEDDSFFFRVELFKDKIKLVDKDNAFEVLHIQPEECGYSKLKLQRLKDKQGLSQYDIDTQYYCKFIPKGTEKLSDPETIRSLLTKNEKADYDMEQPTIGAIDKGVTNSATVLVILQTTPTKQINYIGSFTDEGKNPSKFLEKIEAEIQPMYRMFPILVDSTSDDTLVSVGARFHSLPMVGFKFDGHQRKSAMQNMKVIIESVVRTPDGLTPRLRIPANDEGRRLIKALIDTQFNAKHHLDDRVAALLMALWQARSIIYEEPEESNTCMMCGAVQKGGDRCKKCGKPFYEIPVISNDENNFSVNDFSSNNDWGFSV